MSGEVFTSQQVGGAIRAAGLAPVDAEASGKLAAYGNLLLKWNTKTNLTSITEPVAVLDRHIVECVAAAQALPPGVGSLLDYGSGAGLPGIPIAICRPEIVVTLAESQSKKAAFLQEAKRTLGLSITVFSGRVVEIGAAERFDLVTMRAVDRMEAALSDAIGRVSIGGWLVLFATEETDERLLARLTAMDVIHEDQVVERKSLPTAGHLVFLAPRAVPRGTTL